MRTSRLLGGLRSRRARLGTAAAIAVLGAVATVELTAAFVASPPPAIAGQAPAAIAADPNCSGLITLVCGSAEQERDLRAVHLEVLRAGLEQPRRPHPEAPPVPGPDPAALARLALDAALSYRSAPRS